MSRLQPAGMQTTRLMAVQQQAAQDNPQHQLQTAQPVRVPQAVQTTRTMLVQQQGTQPTTSPEPQTVRTMRVQPQGAQTTTRPPLQAGRPMPVQQTGADDTDDSLMARLRDPAVSNVDALKIAGILDGKDGDWWEMNGLLAIESLLERLNKNKEFDTEKLHAKLRGFLNHNSDEGPPPEKWWCLLGSLLQDDGQEAYDGEDTKWKRIVREQKDSENNTLLHWAAQDGNKDACKVLVEEFGVALEARNKEGRRPCDVATSADIQEYLAPKQQSVAMTAPVVESSEDVATFPPPEGFDIAVSKDRYALNAARLSRIVYADDFKLLCIQGDRLRLVNGTGRQTIVTVNGKRSELEREKRYDFKLDTQGSSEPVACELTDANGLAVSKNLDRNAIYTIMPKGSKIVLKKTLSLPSRNEYKELLKSRAVKHVVLKSESKMPIQWVCAEISNTCYIAFRGTIDAEDALVDVGGLPEYDLASLQDLNVGVHSGMAAMLQGKGSGGTLEAVKAQIRGIGKPVVLCGHSLGGGYAVLAALHLVAAGKFKVEAVRTFGCPTVVDPKGVDGKDVVKGMDLKDSLKKKCVHYVHAWDLVPRLPGCDAWMSTVVPSVKLQKWWFSASLQWLAQRGGVDLQKILGELATRFVDYDIFGSTFMLSMHHGFSAMAAPTNSNVKGLLNQRNEEFERKLTTSLVSSFHSMEKYLDIVEKLKL